MSSSREDQEQEHLETLASAELGDPDASYEVFHKEPSIYTPMSVASTAPTSMMTQSFERLTELTDTSSSDACVHRKWEELAETWKTTVGAPVPPPHYSTEPLSPSSLGEGTDLLLLSPLSKQCPASPTFNPSRHSVVDPDFLMPTPDTEEPFRPYGFEWSKTPASRWERTSRLTTYTNMCVFDRLYNQANVPNSPHRVLTPQPKKRTTPKSKTKTIHHQAAKLKSTKYRSDAKSPTRHTKSATKKSKPTTVINHVWKTSSKYPRDFGPPPPLPAGTNKGKMVQSRLFESTACFQAKTGSSTKTKQSTRTPTKNASTKTQPANKSQPKHSSPERRSDKKNTFHYKSFARITPDERTSSPTRKKHPHHKSPAPWKSPSRSPRSFGLQHASPEPICTIQMRMMRTEQLKELMDHQGEGDPSTTDDAMRLRPWLQHPLDSSHPHQQKMSLQIPMLEDSKDQGGEHYPLSINPTQFATNNHSQQQQHFKDGVHYSPVTAASAMSAVQSKYKKSHNSIEFKHELVAAYRQARHKVEQEQQQQQPMTLQLSLSHSSSWSMASTPSLSLRDKWKAKQPMHQRHVAAKRIQHWYRRTALPKQAAVRVLQRWCRETFTKKLVVKQQNQAALVIQVSWTYHHKLSQKRLADRKAAEMLQLCWWRKLSPEETKRVEKATTKHPYSHIPLQVQQFVRESRQDRAAEAETAIILELQEDRANASDTPESEPEETKLEEDPQKVKNDGEGRPILRVKGKAGDEKKKTQRETKDNRKGKGKIPLLEARTESDVGKKANKPNDTIAKVQLMRSMLHVRHIDLSVGKKKVAMEKQRWEEKISSRPTSEPTKAAARKRAKKPNPMPQSDEPRPLIDLEGLYRNAFAVRFSELSEMRCVRIQAAQQLQKWWTTSLHVWVRTNQRRRASTKFQAVYRGYRCFTVYRQLLWCSDVIQHWWRACLKGNGRASIRSFKAKRHQSARLPRATKAPSRSLAARTLPAPVDKSTQQEAGVSPSPQADASSPGDVAPLTSAFARATKFAFTIMIVVGCMCTFFTLLLIFALYKVDVHDGIVTIKHDRH